MDAEHEGSDPGISRKRLLAGGAAAGAALGLGGASVAFARPQAPARANPEDEELILVNGKIHTLDAQDRVVSAVTVRNGRFVAVGPGVVRRGRNNVDLKGRMVVPGLVENHNHIVLMGVRPGYHTPLENAYSIAEAQATLAARRPAVPEGRFITTIGGFNPNQFAELRLPTLAELDAAVPDRGVYLHVGFNGPGATNTVGKAWLESKGVTVGSDGSIPTAGQQAGRALLALRQAQTYADRKRSALDVMEYSTSLGLTTQLDQGAFEAAGLPSDGAAHENNYTMPLPFLDLHREGRMTIRLRINFLHQDADSGFPTLRERLKNTFPMFGDDWIRTGGIGEFSGAGFGPGWMEGTRAIAQAGWRNENHSLSRTDFQTEISTWEAVNAEFPIVDLRWVVAHAPFITPDYVARLKALGGGISLFGGSRYLTGTAANNGPPYRTILDSGIPCGMGGDGMQVAPLNPWIQLYYVTTGVNARGEPINAGNQVTRQEALRLYTAANKWFIGEDDLGSIEVGNHADLVVLSDDYFRVTDLELKRLRSVLTIVGGKVVHDEGVVRGLP
jgi:predicted amidohydrolase YtcJ